MTTQIIKPQTIEFPIHIYFEYTQNFNTDGIHNLVDEIIPKEHQINQCITIRFNINQNLKCIYFYQGIGNLTCHNTLIGRLTIVDLAKFILDASIESESKIQNESILTLKIQYFPNLFSVKVGNDCFFYPVLTLQTCTNTSNLELNRTNLQNMVILKCNEIYENIKTFSSIQNIPDLNANKCKLQSYVDMVKCYNCSLHDIKKILTSVETFQIIFNKKYEPNNSFRIKDLSSQLISGYEYIVSEIHNMEISEGSMIQLLAETNELKQFIDKFNLYNIEDHMIDNGLEEIIYDKIGCFNAKLEEIEGL